MRPRLLALALAGLTTSLVMLQVPEPVQACAPAPGKGGRVDIATETAVILWDAPAKVQHFIRAASFASTSADFGFLVPTPSKPELSEASADLFSDLAKVTAPRTIVQTKTPEFGCGMKSQSFDAVGSAAPNAVQVLERKRIGDLDAAVLRADDPKALREWLLTNGYDARPELNDWLKFYVENHWIVTAFKIAIEEPGAKTSSDIDSRKRSITGSTVRMSFATDRPFFPYREPVDQRTLSGPTQPRLLRVYLLASSRFDGTLGAGSTAWPGRTVWANPIDKPRFEATARGAKLPDAQVAELAGRDWWLTEFEDRASPRPGIDEVYFARRRTHRRSNDRRM